MDGRALRDAMGRALPLDRYPTLVEDMNAAMGAAGCTTEPRAAMWCAQIGHESAGLRYFEEIASGSAYNGRRDLGNTQPGDGPRFKGRGPIQLTGRHNYGRFTEWCRGRGLNVDFVRDPAVVASSRWGFLAASWYWTEARPKLNALSDAGDIVGATRAINGGTNGLDDRRARWERCRRLGGLILPGGAPAGPGPGPLRLGARDDPATERWQAALREHFPLYAGDLVVDGDYGEATMKATAEFQRRAEVTGPGADGSIVGPRTAEAARRIFGWRG